MKVIHSVTSDNSDAKMIISALNQSYHSHNICQNNGKVFQTQSCSPKLNGWPCTRAALCTTCRIHVKSIHRLLHTAVRWVVTCSGYIQVTPEELLCSVYLYCRDSYFENGSGLYTMLSHQKSRGLYFTDYITFDKRTRRCCCQHKCYQLFIPLKCRLQRTDASLPFSK